MIEVAEYIGLPFAKFNCAALVVKVSRELFGLDMPLHISDCEDPLDREEVSQLISGEIAHRWERIAAGREAMGDVVLFRIAGLPVHCGLMLGGGRFIHVLPGTEACIERLDAVRWRRRVVGFYRFKSSATL